MIILKQIAVNDFLSHKTTRITLKEGDKLLLDGVSGSGKSSIIDALLWALYGHGRVDNRSLVRRGAKECSVSVVLYDTEKDLSYQIIRTATTTGKHTIGVLSGKDTFEEVGTGGVRDTDEYIAQILGASYQLFINSVVFPQDNTESFVTATGVRRKELLLEILKTADIDEYLAKTRALIAEKSSTIATKGGALDASTKLVESYETKVTALPQLLIKETELVDGVNRTRDSLILAQKTHETIQKAYDAQAEDGAALEKLYKTLEWLLKFDTPEFSRTQCEEILKDEDNVRAELRTAIGHNNELSAAMSDRPQIRNYDSEIESIDRRIRKLVDETLPCPSGDACPYTKLIGPELADLKKERAKKEEDNAQQKLGMKDWENRIEKMGARIDTIELENKLKTIDLARVNLREHDELAKQDEVRKEITRLEGALASAPTITDVRQKLLEEERVAAQVRVLETELANVAGSIKYLETLGDEIKRLNKEIKDLTKEIGSTKDEVELLSELRDALGTSGITAVALDYLLPSLEDKINEILGMLSDFKVQLSTQKDGATGAKVEGLFITVVNSEGQEFDFNSYSGGERVRISVAISEALASLQKVGFRIMDETVVALDENMTENFTTVLAKIQSRYSQLICVSHLSAVKDMFERRLIVTKLDGISTMS